MIKNSPIPWARQSEDAENRDSKVLKRVDGAIERAVDLKNWWDEAFKKNSFKERFEETADFSREQGCDDRDRDSSFGFFDKTSVAGRNKRIMGNFQTMFYDRPKCAEPDQAAEYMRSQIRTFVLRYFMRISDFQLPHPVASEDRRRDAPPFLRPFSLCPDEEPSLKGFGFSQLYYKKKGAKDHGEFSESDRYKIVDLERFESEFEWIVLKVDIFDFSFAYAPFGKDFPQASLPLKSSSYLVVSSEFLVDDSKPTKERLGRYGIGYAFIKNPGESLLAYGPGEFEEAFETITWEVGLDGRVQADMVFVSNRPDRVVNVSADPLVWGSKVADSMSFGMTKPFTSPMREMLNQSPFRDFKASPVFDFFNLAGMATGGYTERELCLNEKQLLKEFLLKHFEQHYQTVRGSVRTWRRFPDWTDEPKLPPWVVDGKSTTSE